jgi:Tfp pilus assembly protein FimT
VNKYRQLVKGMSKTELVILFAVAAVVLWYAIGGARDWYDSRQFKQEAEAARKEAQQARADAAAAQARVVEAEGKVNDAEKQVAVANAQRDAAAAERDRAAADVEAARARSAETRTAYRSARQNPVRRSGTVDDRVKRLGADFDDLFKPDGDSARPNP